MWVLTSVDDITASEATSHLDEDAEHHRWTLHDLSVIWQTLLWRGCVRPLLRGFELYQKVRTDGERAVSCLPANRSRCLQIIQSRPAGMPQLCVFTHLPQECPLVLVLQMFELCCDYRNFSEAKLKLLDFQKTLLTVRKQNCAWSSAEITCVVG